MTGAFDLSVYFVADPSCCAGRDIAGVVMDAVRGGVTMVQYRNKSGNMPEIHAQAAMIAELLKDADVPFLINDHIDVAFAVEADGVHLGQGDASPATAREKLGSQAIIGQTAFTSEHMQAIDSQVVDYVGTGPFYPTQTDKGKPVLGAEEFAALVKLSPVPVVGIGGITAGNAAAVIDAGAHGVAMMRAISEAESPEAAAQEFTKVLS
ncbi:MAG: thiamine phosphate synthase [Alphaproteobacteria bacterium]|nr:thiamine phosphate synthase [Alphaproteobacteria bacterium]